VEQTIQSGQTNVLPIASQSSHAIPLYAVSTAEQGQSGLGVEAQPASVRPTGAGGGGIAERADQRPRRSCV